jgi:DNA-binding winged helix-turn-helix (wHTH) protein/tetratricopeptide (TPR) repeat protein
MADVANARSRLRTCDVQAPELNKDSPRDRSVATVPRQWSFGPFRLDAATARLWRGDEVVPLSPKAFEVLRVLVMHCGSLVTKQALLDAVWPDTTVVDAVLKVCVGELRKVLGDHPRAPRFIETADRRGYRFVAPVTSLRLVPPTGSATKVLAPPPVTVRLVEREAVLRTLEGRLGEACRKTRQVVFVTGEPGVGKTAVVHAFAAQLAGDHGTFVASGQCVERHGAGDAYKPVLEALGRLCRNEGERVIGRLRRSAPLWLAQLPWLLADDARDSLRRELLGATPQRMLREMSEAVESLGTDATVVLVLEDLHWSDRATIDLISFLARRREPMRLLVLATYRPVDVIVSGHPLRQTVIDLGARGRCHQLPLPMLSERAVADFLAVRFPGAVLPPSLVRTVHRRTDGNPLFVVEVTEQWVAHGMLARGTDGWTTCVAPADIEASAPDGLREMIEHQLEQTSDADRRILEAASVVGQEFSVATLAPVIGADPATVGGRCDRLVGRGRLLRRADSENPVGTLAARYRFIHWVHQNVCYHRVDAGRRARLHRAVAEREEHTAGARSGEIAAALAEHFERGRDLARAVSYLRLAAGNAAGRCAHREALDTLGHALELVGRSPDDEQATLAILPSLLKDRGLVHRAMGDERAAADDFGAAARIAARLGQPPVEAGARLHEAAALSWFDSTRCLVAVDRAVELVRGLDDAGLAADTAAWSAYWHLIWVGWRDEQAQRCADAVETLRHARGGHAPSTHVVRYSLVECLRSDYAASAQTAEEGVATALREGASFEYLLGEFFWSWALLHAGRWDEMRHVLHDGMRIAARNGQPRWKVLFRLELAWLHDQAFDFERARELAAYAVERADRLDLTYGQILGRILLGSAYLGLGARERAVRLFDEVAGRLEREHVLMGWILRLPLHLGQARSWLARRRPAEARREAEQLCELAAQPGERTYLALGFTVLADCAAAEQQWSRALAHVERARATAGTDDTPLAAWRIEATAARLASARGEQDEARACRARAAAVLARLATTLRGAPGLQHALSTARVLDDGDDE